MNTKQIARAITEALEAKGVHVTTHPATSTSSIYLSFDGGLLKQARVADHKGKGYAYAYEIGSHIPQSRELQASWEARPFTRYHFPADGADDLVTQVLVLRSNLRAKYGKDWYERTREQGISERLPRTMRRALV